MYTIKQLISAGKFTSSAEKLFKFSCVNIGFVNTAGKDDETQLIIEHPINSEKGIEELSALFCSLCKELETSESSVTYIHVVASAPTRQKLENFG